MGGCPIRGHSTFNKTKSFLKPVTQLLKKQTLKYSKKIINAMILTKPEILKEIRAKRVKIAPLSRKAIGPASIDLSLGNKIRVFKPADSIILVNENLDHRKITEVVDISKGFVLKPRQLILGITKEKITLPEDIAGLLNSRSRFARIGLMSHITAPFLNPGISNYQILEIFNAGQHPLRLTPGTRICQLILVRCQGRAKYRGKFKDQKI